MDKEPHPDDLDTHKYKQEMSEIIHSISYEAHKFVSSSAALSLVAFLRVNEIVERDDLPDSVGAALMGSIIGNSLDLTISWFMDQIRSNEITVIPAQIVIEDSEIDDGGVVVEGDKLEDDFFIKCLNDCVKALECNLDLRERFFHTFDEMISEFGDMFTQLEVND